MAIIKNIYVGVDIGGINIKSALVVDGNIVERRRLPTMADTGVKGSINQIKSAVEPFIEKASGIGIGIAGLIDSKKGIVKYSPNLPGWLNIKLVQRLQKEYKKPIKIMNDATAFCLGEWQFGAGRGYNNLFLLTLGTGLGGGAVCEGKPLFGAHGFAGELGHTVINPNGRKCPCGNRGCLERYVGAQYIIMMAKRMMKKHRTRLRKYKKLTPHIIADEAKKGDRIACRIFTKIGYYVGIGVGNIILIFDPEVVIVAGGISRAGKILFDKIKETVAERVMGAQFRKYKIVLPQLGDDAGVLGAVYYAQTTCRK